MSTGLTTGGPEGHPTLRHDVIRSQEAHKCHTVRYNRPGGKL